MVFKFYKKRSSIVLMASTLLGCNSGNVSTNSISQAQSINEAQPRASLNRANLLKNAEPNGLPVRSYSMPNSGNLFQLRSGQLFRIGGSALRRSVQIGTGDHIPVAMYSSNGVSAIVSKGGYSGTMNPDDKDIWWSRTPIDSLPPDSIVNDVVNSGSTTVYVGNGFILLVNNATGDVVRHDYPETNFLSVAYNSRTRQFGILGQFQGHSVYYYTEPNSLVINEWSEILLNDCNVIEPKDDHPDQPFLCRYDASASGGSGLSYVGIVSQQSTNITWNFTVLNTSSALVNVLSDGNGSLLAVTQNGGVYSYNGTNWNLTSTIRSSTDITGVVSMSDSGPYIALAQMNSGKNDQNNDATPWAYSSVDGNTWTSTEIPRFSYMKAGSNSVCALESASTRSIYCWGDNESGQLGFGSSGGIIPLSKATTLSNLISAQIAVGGSHACALTADAHFQSGAYCWGSNSSGQLGNGTYTSSSTPTQITPQPSMASLTRIYSGTAFTCAIDYEKQVWCWGSNAYGQLGMDPRSRSNSSNPVQIRNFSALTSADRFALGNNHACAISPQHYLYCWGNNSSGQLGIGTSIPYVTVPTLVKLSGSNPQVAKVYAGGDNTCAIDVNGSGYCWGRNNFGQIGNGTVTPQVNTPTMIAGNFKYKELHPSSLHTCGISSQYDGICWGDNSYGELGDGKASKIPQDTPYIITGQNKWVNMTTGYGFTCATDLYEGRNYCWGKNSSGQLGINSLESYDGTPLSINSN